jgi:hypothetical protein
MLLPTLIALVALGSEPIPPDKAAQIEVDYAKEQAKVDEKFGNRKLSEMSQEERRELTRERAAAEQRVLDKHGVDAKQWAREQMKRDRTQYADMKQRVKEREAQEKAAKEAAAAAARKAAGENAEIPVQRGINEQNPVVLMEAEGAPPIVEKGLPGEAAADQAAASGASDVPGSAQDSAPAPSRGARRR